MAEDAKIELLEDRDKKRRELLEKARAQFKIVINKEIERLKAEAAFLKTIGTTGIDDAKQQLLGIDEVLVVNELDEFFGVAP